MTKIFCQNCYSTTHDVAKSVYDVNTSGRCSKCDSDAVLSPEVVAGAINAERRQVTSPSEDRWSLSPQGGQGKRCIESNFSFIGAADLRVLLINHAQQLDEWWDGHYFEIHFCFLCTASQTMDILIENRNGDQRYITFEVTMNLIHPVDSITFNANAAIKTP